MKYLKHTIVFLLGMFSIAYLANIGAGVVEFLPDNLPVIGNLDEAGAALLLLNCLAYFGLDLRRLISVKPKTKS